MAVSADSFSLEFGATGYDFNALGARQSKTPLITSSYDISIDPYFNLAYTTKLNDVNLKVGLLREDMMGTIQPSFVDIGRLEPYIEASADGLTFRTSFPTYFLNYDTVNDPNGKEIGYIFDKNYKGIYLSTKLLSTNLIFTNYESLSYKLTFDKTFATIFSASTDLGISPIVWAYDVKPQISFICGPVQLDLKESIYFADASLTPSFSDTAYNTRYYTDPKLTFDLGSIGLKGLKAYVAASIFTADVSKDGTFWYGSGDSKFSAFGSSITPGLSFTTGPLYIETAFKYSNYDDSLSNVAGKEPTFDPMIKVSYTLSF